MKPHLVVVGSLNMDFVVSVAHLPAPGETVLGTNFQMIPGGKGANQACAAGKLGAQGILTKMIGRTGYDIFADHLKASLSAAGVDVSAVHATRSQPTGVALIPVEASGQNNIIVASGANHALTPSDVRALRPVFQGAAYVLFQLETPLDAVEAGLELAHGEGAKTILDPAPAQLLSESILKHVDILTPNETEASILLGREPGSVSVDKAPAMAEALLVLGVTSVVLKLGENGALYCDSVRVIHVPAFAVDVCDTTAAGDTFNAALAVALTEGKEIGEALRFSNGAAAISVTRAGAQSSIPSRAEVDEFLASR
jgi:ribokinase